MPKNLFWIDLEMTGLDEKVHAILEVAVVITDLNLEPLDQYHAVVFQPQDVLDQMDDWCKQHHGQSGLTAAIPNGKPLALVERELLELANRYYVATDRIVLTGNSVGNDQRFIVAYMPTLAARLHYRVVDVSSFKEIFKHRYGIHFKKENNHRALDDILESIRELRTYLSFVNVTEEAKKLFSRNGNGDGKKNNDSDNDD